MAGTNGTTLGVGRGQERDSQDLSLRPAYKDLFLSALWWVILACVHISAAFPEAFLTQAAAPLIVRTPTARVQVPGWVGTE